MQRLPDKRKVRPAASVLFESLPGGGTVLLNRETEHLFSLNLVGARMWAALVSNDSVEEMLGELQDEFAVSAETVRQDLDEFLTKLEDEGLIEVRVV